MNLLGIALLAQLSTSARQSPPVLSFPEAGLDDTAAYQGYQTRFFRDAAGNTVQVYLDGRSGRVVHLWADAEDESAGFTARTAQGAPASLVWDGDAKASASGRTRALTFRLLANVPRMSVGWFLLGSMRVERDLQYSGRHRSAFADAPFLLPEIDRALAAMARLEPTERNRHLALLSAPDIAALRARLQPAITTRRTASQWTARAVQPSLDGRDTLTLELTVDSRRIAAARAGDSISFQARAGDRIPFTVRITTTGKPLTRLLRTEIFKPDFLAFLNSVDPGTVRSRWLERQVRGVELLSSREKLMAGLPAYATYFGRDMLVSALMMRPIWRDEMSEFAIASVLRKLSPKGEVSHEEALGGQADREATAEYASLMEAHFAAGQRGDRVDAARYLEHARAVLRDHRRVRENYHMIDDEFQFPVLTAGWLGNPRVSARHKRAFLLDSADGGGTRLARLLRELSLVADMTASYAADPVATHLVSFAPRDSGRWSSASWRDSGAGYAEGRFAMDVNAVWAPHALEAIGQILHALRALGIRPDSIAGRMSELARDAPFRRYASDSLALRRATNVWWGASRHFLVRLAPTDVRAHVSARLAAMPEQERGYWANVLERSRADQDSLVFLALSLDTEGRPIGVANTDPATRLFLGERPGAVTDSAAADALRDARLFVRAYPVGLFIDRVGPVVANDAYTPQSVWPAFERDQYHGPRVVWGREVNLFLLGVADHIASAPATPAGTAYADELRAAMTKVLGAVEASGFHSELWSYEIANGQLNPIRYGSGSDVQLWSTTDLAVQFALSRLRP